jgi:S-adenosylmethionine synthetase
MSAHNGVPAIYRFTSESVTPGHPDKMSDGISDAVVDAALGQDPHSRVACEVMVTTGLVVISGEISTLAELDLQRIARETIAKIGYTDDAIGFNADSAGIVIAVNKQSPDIAQGVERALEARELASDDDGDVDGAGDQGMMFGYATSETAEGMPMAIALAHALARKLMMVRESGAMPYLRPDGKTQVTVRYEQGRPVAVEKVLVSAHHAPGVDRKRMRDDIWEHVVAPTLDPALYDERELRTERNFLVNPTGRFVKGGPAADAGLTGRKIIVDTYGGMARHGGGAFSGKDPSKVDRSGAYAARYVAKNLMMAGVADRVEVQLAYAIGVAHPLSVMVDTFGTEKIDPARIEALVNEHFDLRPGAIRAHLDLHRPIYGATSAFGHFGRSEPGFTWERADMAEALADAAGTTVREVMPA